MDMAKVTLGGFQVCYRDKGKQHLPPPAPGGRLPVILIHGAAGGAHVWFDQLGILSRTRRTVAIDLPGHGCSKHFVSSTVTISDYAKNVLDLAAALGLDRVVLVGHSMGGAIALQAALTAPSRVAGLVLAATSHRLPVSDQIFDVIENHFESFGDLLAAFAFSDAADPDMVKLWTEPPLVATQSTVLADFRACDVFDVTDQLHGIRCPALVLHGDLDKMVTRAQVVALASKLQHGMLTEFSGVGHMLFQEAAEAATDAVERFVSQLDETEASQDVKQRGSE